MKIFQRLNQCTTKFQYLLFLLIFFLSLSTYAQLTFQNSIPSTAKNNVPRNANVVLYFNEAVHSATVNATNIIISGDQTGEITGVFTGGGTNTIVFDPTENFKPGEEVSVKLTSNVTSLSSNALTKPIYFSFIVVASANTFFKLGTATKNILEADKSPSTSSFASDLDGDGDMDIVAAFSSASGVTWYENDGNQSFTKHHLNDNKPSRTLKVIDLDRDGNLDILAGFNVDNQLVWYQNNGNGVFAAESLLMSGLDGIDGIDAVDMDGDGDIDIITASAGGNHLDWLENNGSQVFTRQSIDADFTNVSQVIAKDLDDDGDVDIVARALVSSSIYWYKNNGNQVFTKETIATNLPFITKVAIADIDNDGDLDIVSNSFYFNSVYLLTNDGNESFAQSTLDANINKVFAFSITDIDNDGDMDVLTVSDDDQAPIYLLENDNVGNFTKKAIMSEGFRGYVIQAVDMDSDGDLDIMASGSTTEESVIWLENVDYKFTENTSTNWDTATNWDKGSVPTNIDKATILEGNTVIASGGVSVNGLEIQSNASVTIGNTITNTESIVMASGSSLIAKQATIPKLTYNRYLLTNNWYLVSSPVVGEDYLNLYNTHYFATGTGANIGMGLYDNGVNSWQYLQNNLSSSPFPLGSGMAVKLITAADLSFTGEMLTEDKNDINITLNQNGLNLIGNPYPSYISLNDVLNANDEGTNDLLVEKTTWFWDQTANEGVGDYQTFNLIHNYIIAPGQCFFIEASSAAMTFSITEAMQSHQPETGDTFLRTTTATRPEIQLSLSNGTSTKSSEIYYISGTTLGWDNGYDSTLFEGADNSFEVYTHLLSDSQGQDLAIQSLPDTNYENMVIPIGVNANSGTAITISANAINLPEGINVYLEDTHTNIFTLLDATTDYTITTTSNLNGIGRFYLHTATESLLNVPNETLDHIGIYTTNKTNLQITGINSGQTTLSIYSIVGKEVFKTVFEGQGVNNVSIPKVSSGMYIVKIATSFGILSKKIIL